METQNWDRIIKWSEEKQMMVDEMTAGGKGPVGMRGFSDLISQDKRYRLFHYLLNRARYSDGVEYFEGHRVKLQRGQLVTSQRRLENDKRLGLTRQQIRTAVAFWESMLFLTQQITHHYTIITLWIYNKFDKFGSELGHTKEHARNAQGTHIIPQEVENTVPFDPLIQDVIQDVKKKISASPKVEAPALSSSKKSPNYSADSDEMILSALLLEKIKERDDRFREPNLQGWAGHIDRLIRIDQRTPEEIRRVIEWSQADSFWKTNILSTGKLREQFSALLQKMPKGKTEALNKMKPSPVDCPYPNYDSKSVHAPRWESEPLPEQGPMTPEIRAMIASVIGRKKPARREPMSQEQKEVRKAELQGQSETLKKK